jgi:hypothetical protein
MASTRVVRGMCAASAPELELRSISSKHLTLFGIPPDTGPRCSKSPVFKAIRNRHNNVPSVSRFQYRRDRNTRNGCLRSEGYDRRPVIRVELPCEWAEFGTDCESRLVSLLAKRQFNRWVSRLRMSESCLGARPKGDASSAVACVRGRMTC